MFNSVKSEHDSSRVYLWLVIIVLFFLFWLAVRWLEEPPVRFESTPTPIVSVNGRQYSVFYNKGVFSPTILRIRLGDVVRFLNSSPEQKFLLVAQSAGGEVILKSDKIIMPGESWLALFGELGIFTYHNELRPQESGTIVVQAR